MKPETKPAQHTPGPWIVDMAKNNTHLASVYHGAERPFLERPWNVAICTGPQSEANATLIASAPELLEALQDAFALIVNGPNGCDDDPARIIAQARAAIAKAKGGVK